MKSSRPYLLRALYEWIVDNQLTPYLLVNTEMVGVDVPRQYIEDGKIILNIAPSAVHDLYIDNQIVEFDASFSGAPATVQVPIGAVLAIYARENGRGMVFDQTEEVDDDSNSAEIGTDVQTPTTSQRSSTSRKPKLTVVK
jgi:stringent starvation protein B